MNRTFTQQLTISEDLTAAKLGSGLLPVYATPAVVALMENTACALIAAIPAGEDGALKDGDTTVGTRIAVDHVKACLPGEVVTAEAMLTAIEGRQYSFLVTVKNAEGELLANAEHTRFLVSADRFMQKLQNK